MPGFRGAVVARPAGSESNAAADVERIAAATAYALSTPEVKSAFAAQGFDALVGAPDDFAAFYRSEVDKWRKVIVATGMSL